MNYIVKYYKSFGKLPIPSYKWGEDEILDFKKSPDELLERLRAKGVNSITKEEWNKLTDEAKEQAFTVAQIAKADVIQEVYDYIEKAVENGWSLDKFKKRVKEGGLVERMQQAGWSGKSTARLNVIYDTNVSLAYAKGKYNALKTVSDLKPYWVYHQIDRTNKRVEHSKWNGKKFRHDDPIWDTIFPPSAFNCHCWVSATDDPAGVESGLQYLDELQKSKDYQLSPLKVWKPETEKYVEGLRKEIEKARVKKNNLVIIPKLSLDNYHESKLVDKLRDPELLSGVESRLKVIYNQLELNGLPQVLNKNEFDTYNLKDYYLVYRGLTESKYYDDFKYGDNFAGKGIHGDGTYTALNVNDSYNYSDTGDVMKILFPKNANIITKKELKRKAKEFMSRENAKNIAIKKLNYEEEHERLRALMKEAFDNNNKEALKVINEEYMALDKKLGAEIDDILGKLSSLYDLGMFATVAGYDAILVDYEDVLSFDNSAKGGYLIILNRAKCIVQKEQEKIL